MELIKRAALEGDYDLRAYRQLYDYRAQIAHQSVVMSAIRAARDMRWGIEIFEKQRLSRQHDEVSAEITRLHELEKTLLDKFRDYYTLGNLDIQLLGPPEVEVGTDAHLRCTVRRRTPQPGMSSPQGALPPDLERQLVYEWKIGEVSLGADNRAERTYRLMTPGQQTYHVTVKRLRQFGGDDVLGTAAWTINVKPRTTATVPTALGRKTPSRSPLRPTFKPRTAAMKSASPHAKSRPVLSTFWSKFLDHPGRRRRFGSQVLGFSLRSVPSSPTSTSPCKLKSRRVRQMAETYAMNGCSTPIHTLPAAPSVKKRVFTEAR
ncbi:MAG: hypothetical protein ACUVR8_13140 [Acidobacteriota bacterium]